MFSDILHTLGYIYYIHENVTGTLFGNTTNILFKFILFPNYVESTPISRCQLHVFMYMSINSSALHSMLYLNIYTHTHNGQNLFKHLL